MTERILTVLALMLLALATLYLLGLWALAGQFHPAALCIISFTSFAVSVRARRRR